MHHLQRSCIFTVRSNDSLLFLQLWKAHWVILRRPSSKGPFRLDRYSNEKASTHYDAPEKSDKLENIQGIELIPPETRKYALAVMLNNSQADSTMATLQFCTDSGNYS